MSKADKAKWAMAQKRAGRGRPVVGEGAVRMPVTIEQSLFREVKAFARKHKLKRSEMIAQGLRLVMAKKSA